MIVVDTNVIAYLLLRSEGTPAAREVYRRDPEWIVPGLWRHELLNVLTLHVKVGSFAAESAWVAWREAERLLLSGERSIRMSRALQVAIEHDISAYDAQFVALAERLDVPLVTADRRLRERAGPRALSMEAFCAEGS